jgi:transcriptional regulator with XRE-family HTH domain
MPTAFAEKLRLALRALSLTRAALAAELGMDKSIVVRWAAGSVAPSAHSLSRITAVVARRVEGFSTIDWDRSLAGLASD